MRLTMQPPFLSTSRNECRTIFSMQRITNLPCYTPGVMCLIGMHDTASIFQPQRMLPYYTQPHYIHDHDNTIDDYHP